MERERESKRGKRLATGDSRKVIWAIIVLLLFPVILKFFQTKKFFVFVFCL